MTCDSTCAVLIRLDGFIMVGMLLRPSTVSTSAATADGTLASDDGARYVLPLTEYECSDVLYAASVCAAVPETWTAWLLAETTCSPVERSHDSTAATCAAEVPKRAWNRLALR